MGLVTEEGMSELPAAMAFTFDTELPKEVVFEVETMLRMARYTFMAGHEVPLVFVGINADFHPSLIQTDNIPKAIIRPMMLNFCEEMKIKAVISMSEGYSLPPKAAEDRVKNGGQGQIKDHPEAFEIFMVQVETVLGTWAARLPFTVKSDGKTDRTPEGVMVFEKANAVGGNYNNLLPENRTLSETDQTMMKLAAIIGGWKNVTPDGEDEVAPTGPSESVN